jgi:hypothetical protein
MEPAVFESVLLHIQAKIRALDDVMTIHVDEEMDDDALTILDVEQVILTGQIAEQQRDRNTGDWKYLINGQTDDGLDVIAVHNCAFRHGRRYRCVPLMSNVRQQGDSHVDS